MITDLLKGGPSALADAVVTIGTLGTASFGLVDVSKAMRGGGPSSFGFSAILRAVHPFEPALREGSGPDWSSTLRSHWINGMALDDQKARAKALIHLGLTPQTAPAIARGLDGRVGETQFTAVAGKLETGANLTPEDINIMGRFDVLMSAALDAGYERADQQYRNRVKLIACFVAVTLAVVAGFLIDCQQAGVVDWKVVGTFVGGPDLWTAAVAGVLATPLAPLAKDLSSALKAAGEAAKAAKG
jgi:hypothetical protein